MRKINLIDICLILATALTVAVMLNSCKSAQTQAQINQSYYLPSGTDKSGIFLQFGSLEDVQDHHHSDRIIMQDKSGILYLNETATRPTAIYYTIKADTIAAVDTTTDKNTIELLIK